MISPVSLPFINSAVMLLVCIKRVSSESGFNETKEILAVNCNFYSPLFFLSFIKSSKYGFIKSKYSVKLNELLPSLPYSK